jgi:hypothetical protein
MKALALAIAGLLIMLVVPVASADICNGPCGNGGGTGGGGGSGGTNFFHPVGAFLSIHNAFDGGPFADKTVTEGDTCSFTVTRRGSAKRPVSVRYFTEDGSATAPGDYVPVSQDSEGNTVNFEAGQRTTTIDVGTFAAEDDNPGGGENPSTIETFTVHLFQPHHAKIKRRVGTCQISEAPTDFEV